MSVPAAFLSQLFTRKAATFSGTSLIIYDYLITLPLEPKWKVKYIWNAPWTAVKAGFLLNRYGNLIGQTFITMEETGYLNHGSSKFCTIFGLFVSFFTPFSGESIRILVLLRAWAIWGCMYRVTAFLISLYVFYILAVIASVIYPQTKIHSTPYLYLEYADVCIVPIFPHLWLIWFTTLVLDTVVLAMVGHSLRKLFRESRDIYPLLLVHLLVRDAVLFYATSVLNGVLSMVCWSVFRTDPRNFLQLALSFPLLSVIGQRLILNLRGFQGRPFTTRDISREVDRQMAAMGELWLDSGADDGQAHRDESENRETNQMTGMIDLDIEVAEVERSQDPPIGGHLPLSSPTNQERLRSSINV